MGRRFCVKMDESGSYYIIPLELADDFDSLLYEGDDTDMDAFYEKFSQYDIGSSFEGWTFLDPQKGE